MKEIIVNGDIWLKYEIVQHPDVLDPDALLLIIYFPLNKIFFTADPDIDTFFRNIVCNCISDESIIRRILTIESKSFK